MLCGRELMPTAMCVCVCAVTAVRDLACETVSASPCARAAEGCAALSARCETERIVDRGESEEQDQDPGGARISFSYRKNIL